ncbi:ergothioneine biosynthesis protein EgtB [Oceanibaculum pacificum]|uniref:Methyltransferase n=1 Tax=Oceanibaculum pacificum TaxID=580166 RepID=A0A154VYE5_9PROT|nr:ergothioneine biosynthesis protein EgtB [Oceanibaculum pacificum]KZD06354.1 methyltransferase [Oceanibaculum pacificum]
MSIAEKISSSPDALQERFRRVRDDSLDLAAGVGPEDQMLQSMPDASPMKWHLAHTSWFFEVFLLEEFLPGYTPFDEGFRYLFNSYYQAVGAQYPRPQRGLISRPNAAEVTAYRHHVDSHVQRLLDSADDTTREKIERLIEIGCNHEQQHQELMLTDLLHGFAQNPLSPAYRPWRQAPLHAVRPLSYAAVEETQVMIGHAGEGFCFDNEYPRHKALLQRHGLADRLVTNAEWLEFMADGGYDTPALWLSDGWAARQAEGWTAPLYWRQDGEGWTSMTLSGRRPIELEAPVVHVSYYEADAFARWADRRLPTEMEWEAAARGVARSGNLRSSGLLRPAAAAGGAGLQQMFGDVWEWTQSAYLPYPGYKAAEGAIGEYNGKFMINQMVLRGGSCVTPDDHIRASYRNFFYPHQRWQFCGLRLAADAADLAKVHGLPRQEAIDDVFQADVLTGLSRAQKMLPSKYLYDPEGSRLFEDICELPEYYVPGAERAVMEQALPHLAGLDIEDAALVEFGSGASVKTRRVLDSLPWISAYVPIDISAAHLAAAAASIDGDYPDLQVVPLAGDFTQRLTVPAEVRDRPLFGFFPGSTIGNFTPEEATGFLANARRLLAGGRLLIGADLRKDQAVLEAAYDDAQGVTAAFDLNLLARINRELGGDIDLAKFRHRAIWNEAKSRIEMHLESLADQTFGIAGWRFAMKRGETIHTENSHKFTVAQFTRLASEAGWRVERHWVNPAPEFAVFLLRDAA